LILAILTAVLLALIWNVLRVQRNATLKVADFLAMHPVGLWFGKIERDVIAQGVFTSVSDLKKKPLRYIRQYNKSPRTVKWKYADPSRHISTQSVGTGH